ncbi:Cytochrome p450 CYP199A2 [Paraconexibacter sp. AEG42_29]|uniref:Cytochrome p450 CYP199A2 n=1 Tax=Paraconexibacter sp. AEG42_29 TaxID=2997339 RepID=A0AAU7AUD9_9ACTN
MRAPALDVDLYADSVLADSTDLWARIRDAGPVVWLPRHRLYAMGRYADVRAALRDDAGYRSGHGVAANPVANALGRDTTLASDEDVHVRRRRVLMHELGAKAIAAIDGPLRREAEDLVDDLTCRRHFETARDFSSRLPVSVVAELVGVRGGGERMLEWAAATFDGLGPANPRGLRSAPRALGLLRYSRGLRPSAVARASWAASVFDAQARGELSAREARALIIDFVAPSLDTTILAGTHLLWALGRNPDVWDRLRADPSLIPAAIVENVRLASPIRGFTRRLGADREVGGVTLPKGARIALLFAAANRDEQQFPDPERFDLGRRGGHLGWGNGPHTCVGIHLAKLELRALLEALVPRVREIVVGRPTQLRNNTLQGIAALPARLR